MKWTTAHRLARKCSHTVGSVTDTYVSYHICKAWWKGLPAVDRKKGSRWRRPWTIDQTALFDQFSQFLKYEILANCWNKLITFVCRMVFESLKQIQNIRTLRFIRSLKKYCRKNAFWGCLHHTIPFVKRRIVFSLSL